MERGKIKPIDIKILPLLRTTISFSTRHYLSRPLLSLAPRLPLSSGTCEAYLREWVLTEETDVTSGRAGTVTCQPLSSLRQCSLKWSRKSLIGILREIRCSSARAAVCSNLTFKRSEKSSHKRCFRAGTVSQWQSCDKICLAGINQVNFKPDRLETSEISEQKLWIPFLQTYMR